MKLFSLLAPLLSPSHTHSWNFQSLLWEERGFKGYYGYFLELHIMTKIPLLCFSLLMSVLISFQLGTLWSLLTAGCNLATSVSPIVTTFLTTSYGWSAAFVTPGAVTVVLSIVIYFVIWDSPSERGLDEFNQIIPWESRTEGRTEKNKKAQVIAILLSPFIWILSIGYLLTLFVKTGVGEWTQLFFIQTLGRSQYDSEWLIKDTKDLQLIFFSEHSIGWLPQILRSYKFCS